MSTTAYGALKRQRKVKNTRRNHGWTPSL